MLCLWHMSRSLPPLGWFRAFESAARLQSFTAAAEDLDMTQSAISQQIRALESRLGCRLFDRKHRGISLTDNGRKLLPDITRAIESIQAATAPFQGHTNTNVLTVGTSVSIAQWYLAPALHEFMQSHPGVQIRLLTAVWPDETSDTTDVQIRFGPANSTNTNSQPLGDYKLTLVASPRFNKHRPPRRISNKQLANATVIQAVGTSDTWANCAERFALNPHVGSSIFVDTHGLAIDFARSGSGVALTSELIAAPSLADGSLVRVHPKLIDSNDGYSVTINSSHHQDTALIFVDWLKKQISDYRT